ncbi:MAG: hypothetical protein ACHQF0_07160 [Chitinophagales bacterium]
MDETFKVEVPDLHKTGYVKKAPFYLSILREGLFSVSVERLPLVEYFVFFDHAAKAEQMKMKMYKTLDGKWYDKNYSEEAEVYSPEFGITEINHEIKNAIDRYESRHEKVNDYIL